MNSASKNVPNRLNEEQTLELKKVVLTKLPWKRDLMIILVEQKLEIHYTLKGMSLIINRLGLCHTRHYYTLENVDPEKQRKNSVRKPSLPQKTNYVRNCPSSVPR